MGLSAIKTNTRLAIHARMSEPCTYTDGENPTVPTLDHQAAGLELRARFHNKMKTHLGEVSGGLAIMEPIEKLVFNTDELALLDLTLEQGSVITFPAYGIAVILDQPLDSDGPQNEYWTCTRA